MRNGTFTNTQDKLTKGCFGEGQTPNTEHSSRIEKVHLDDLDLYVVTFAVLATSV